MIRPVFKSSPAVPSSEMPKSVAAAFKVSMDRKQELEEWVRLRPGLALMLAAMAGVGLACLIKRRH